MAGECLSVEETLVQTVISGLVVIGTLVVCVAYIRNYNNDFTNSNNEQPQGNAGKSDGTNEELRAVSGRSNSKWIRIYASVVLLFGFASAVETLISSILDNVGNCKLATDLYDSVGTVTQLVAFSFLLILFSFRLIQTFKGTAYNLSKTTTNVIIFMNAAQFSLGVFGILLNFILAINRTNDDIIAGITFVYTVMIIGLVISLLRLFVKKLHTVIDDFLKQFGNVSGSHLDQLNRALSADVDRNSNGMGDLREELQVDAETMKDMSRLARLISDMSKYTILLVIASTSTLIAMGVVIVFLAEGSSNEKELNMQNSIYRILWIVDTFINCVCMVLQFKFAQNYYMKMCKSCHSRCEDRYTKKTDKLQRLTSGEIGFKTDVSSGVDVNVNAQTTTDDQGVSPVGLVAQKSLDTLQV